MGATCAGALNVKVSVIAPGGGNSGLITVPSPTTPSIAFAATSAFVNAGAYSVTVQAGFGTLFSTVVASASFTYNYVNPCSTATITANSFASLSVVVGSTGFQQTNLWYDSVSGSAATQVCGLFTATTARTAVSAPSYVDGTMNSMFALTSSLT